MLRPATAAVTAATPSSVAIAPKRGRNKIGLFLSTRSSSVMSTMQVAATSSSETKKKNVVIGLGSCGLDYLALVAAFPKPDDKLRTEKMEMRGGGNCANALTAAARLGGGVRPFLVSRVGSDGAAASIAAELEADGVSTRFLSRFSGSSADDVVPSPTTYIIVDRSGGTRTCIHTPGPAFGAADLEEMMKGTTTEQAAAAATTTTTTTKTENDDDDDDDGDDDDDDNFPSLSAALDAASLVFFDGRLAEAALPLADAAMERGVPILVEAERPREGLDELLRRATFVTTSASFPPLAFAGEAGTLSSSSSSSSASSAAPPHPGAAAAWLLASLPESVAWVSTTLGERGAVLIERDGGSDESEGGGQAAEGREEDAAAVVEEALSLAEEARKSKGSSRKRTAATSSTGVEVSPPGVASLRRRVLRLPVSASPSSTARGDGTIAVNVHASTAASLPAAVVDSTGAGDAFNGALIHALSAGGGSKPLSEVLALACVVAGCNCMGLGARGGLPRSGEDVRWEELL